MRGLRVKIVVGVIETKTQRVVVVDHEIEVVGNANIKNRRIVFRLVVFLAYYGFFFAIVVFFVSVIELVLVANAHLVLIECDSCI